MLGDGFKDGQKVHKRSAIDCALYLAKIINTDFTVANATAWHYWNSFEPGPADSNTLYYLVALNRNRQHDTANTYSITKNAWVLGHYSLFVRPGMQRVETTRDDGKDDVAAAQDVMISAFKDAASDKLVVNMINYTNEERKVALVLSGLPNNKLRLAGQYVTSAKEGDDMKPYPITGIKQAQGSTYVVLPARSVNSFVFKK
jgi:O-glycosyl hydrolase